MKRLFLEIGYADEDKQKQYGRDLLFLSRLFSRFINDVKIDNLRKIAIQLVDSPNKAHIIPANKLILVCLIYEYYDLENYNNEPTKLGKYKILLDLLLNTLQKTSEKFNWPKEPFEDAYSKVIKFGFNNEYVLLQPKLSKDRRFSGSIIANHTQEYVSIIVELIDKKQEGAIKKLELLKVVYFKDDFSDIVHTIKWINNEEFIISNKDGEINFKYSLRNEVLEMFLTPRIHDEKYLQDELKLLNPETSEEEYLEINNWRIANLNSLRID
jgi:hypothetical protein